MASVAEQTWGHSCLQCRVCKLCTPLVFSENTVIASSKNYTWISSQKSDTSVSLTRISSQCKEPCNLHTLSNITSLAWSEAVSVPSFYVVDADLNVAEYCLQGTQFKIVRQWPRGKIVQEITAKVSDVSSVESLTLTHCVSSTCLLLVNKSVFVSIKLENSELCEHVTSVPLPKSDICPRDVPSYRIVSDHLVLLTVDPPTLLVLDIATGSVKCSLDLQSSKLDVVHLIGWSLSHDFSTLILIGQDWMLHSLSLQAYVQSYPKCLNIESTIFHTFMKKRLLLNHSTCHLGDLTWRRQLQALHEEEYISGLKQCRTHKPWRKQPRPKSRISGFKSHSTKHVQVDSETVIDSQELPSDLHDYRVTDVVVGQYAVTLSLKNNDSKALCVLDFSTNKILLKSISNSQMILLSASPARPHLIVSERYIFHVVTEVRVDQEDLVSKLMLYGGAGAADKLCDFNKWGHCTVPVHTLQIGIQHRQLDTVAFFLKSKENLFTSNRQKPSFSPSSTVDESSLWQSPYLHYTSVKQLDSALTLLVEAVQQNVSDQQSRDFAHKLLTLTLEFLYNLVHNGLSVYSGLGSSESEKSEKIDLEKAVDLLMGHIANLRQCLSSTKGLKKLVVKLSSTEEEEDTVDGSEKLGAWLNLSAEESVQTATLNNDLPVLQSHLLTTGETGSATYNQLVRQGIDQVLKYLNKKEMKPAQQILERMGFESATKLWELAEHVTERELQMFVLRELEASGSLSEKQSKQVEFLRELYKIYPSNSFSQAMLRKTQQKNSEWSDDNVIASLLKKDSHEVNAICGDIGQCDELTNQEGLYAEVLLEWLKWWDQETLERILLEGQYESENFILEMYPHRRLLWKYLLSHNRHDDALILLDLMIREVTEDGSIARQRQDAIGDLYSDLHLGNEYIQREVTHRLMRKGFFQPEMLSDLCHLFEELAHVGGVLCTPHPLLHVDPRTLGDFHHLFLHHCIQHQLVLPLWRYCIKHKLKLDQISMDSENMRSWLCSLKHFFTVAHNPDDTDAIYQASLSCAAHIWKMEDPSLTDFIKHDHVTAAIATLPYCSTPLQQVSDTVKLDIFEDIDQNILQNKLGQYPKLYSALFPVGTMDSAHTDVNVYQLLVGSAPLDPRRLFGWQDSNTVAGEDCQKILPYFSQPDLVARFAYTEKIRYTYYLKHGRPTYAFFSFLAEEIDSGVTSISPKRIHTVCGVALWIAVRSFTNASVTSACVAFVEMMGQDSLLLRCYIQAGTAILTYKNNKLGSGVEKRREAVQANEEEVVELLLQVVRRVRKHGPKLVDQLESATMDMIIRQGINSTGFDAAHHWLLTLTLCHLFHLPPSTMFLEECARQDKWLPFLWFAQLHQFPKQQLQGILHQFRSRHLRDHLHYVIENADAKSVLNSGRPGQAATDSKTATKDVRSSLYTKIGLAQAKESGDVSSDEEDLDLTFPDGARSSGDKEQSVDLTMTEDSAPEDVFQVVFVSQTSSCPWKFLLQAAVVLRNSLFAELAACHKDSSLESSLCGWLVAMMGTSEHAQFLRDHGKSTCQWGMSELESLIDIYIQHHWEGTLATGFDIFQTSSPLLPLLKFISELVQWKNYAVCITLLGEFKDAMSNFGQFSKYDDDQQQTVLGGSHWIEQMANQLLNKQLLHVPNLYEALHLTRLLDQENIALVFSFDVPDYGRMHKLIQVLHGNSLTDVCIPAFLSPSSSNFLSESEKVVELLIEKESFSDAYRFAHLTEVSCDKIAEEEMLAEKRKLKGTLVWRSRMARLKFWNLCSDKFQLNKVSIETFISFFQKEADDVEEMTEKASVYHLCLDLMSSVQPDSPRYNDIYKLMWNCRIQAKIAQHKGETETPWDSVEEILSVVDTAEDRKPSAHKSDLLSLVTIPAKRKQVTTEETDALDTLINKLLDEGRIRESCQVTTNLGHYSQDLAIILTCIQLSQGNVTREMLDPEMRRLLSIDRRARSSLGSFSGFAMFPRSSSAVSLSSVVPSWDFLPVEKEDAIVVMERLHGHCNHGKRCCLRVITSFKVACVLDRSYADVVSGEEFAVLDDLLRTSFPQKFILARDYLSTSSLTDKQVASFLSVSIIKALKVCLGGESSPGRNPVSAREMMFNPTEGLPMFGHFIQLCQDPSLLGDNLLEAVTAVGNTDGDLQSNRQALSIQTELLIMAHECHTSACNMEGISHVLRSARIITDNLARAEEFSLMIRLLTGVGRFSEMTFIFDALNQHHQFELLLRKGMEKEGSFKTAVLDYLKRFHPDDRDTYTMVALKFTMYREIAHMLEENGWKNLRFLKDKPMENTRDIVEHLKKSAQYFSDAAESYVKDNCLRHAQQCLRQARLLALQIQHLASGVQVINLNPEQVSILIAQHPKFLEALIVSEAYGKRANWSEAILHNVIAGGDFRYLQELRSHIRLTSTMIQDAVTRYQQSGSSLQQAVSNIKKLLPFCKDVRMQYQIAEDLQLNDVITAMLKSDSGRYLQDIMATS